MTLRAVGKPKADIGRTFSLGDRRVTVASVVERGTLSRATTSQSERLRDQMQLEVQSVAGCGGLQRDNASLKIAVSVVRFRPWAPFKSIA
jgi:hypothetical protein